ncbi:MAG: aryl-sulfate sulfotransferase [Saprospiraceae bacterium]|nr:aryl-sulfate sulfotransferase [Saprospiraceae bacterium]
MKTNLILVLLVLKGFWMFSQNSTALIFLDQENYSPGYNLVYTFGQNDVFLINECGEYVHKWEGTPGKIPGTAAYLSHTRHLLRCSSKGNSAGDVIWAGGAGEFIEWVNWEGEIVYQFQLNNAKRRLHHDIAELPNGNVLAIIWENYSPQEAIQEGRNPNLITEGAIWPDALIEINPQLDSIVWEWKAWDHLIQDFDPAKDNFGDVAMNPGKININHFSASGQADWMHSNGLAYHEGLDLIALSVAHFNEIWFIDHSTSKVEASTSFGGKFDRGGDLVYRWGNPRAYKSGTVQDQQLFFQHDVQWLGDGKISCFNNRANPQYSTVVTFQPVLDSINWQFLRNGTGQFLPQNVDTSFTHPIQKNKLQSSGLSSAQFLSNGNLLVFSGNQGYAFEFKPGENKTVWEYILPFRNGLPISQGSIATNNLSFKIKRYPPDFTAFEGKSLEPQGYLELNPNPDYCAILETELPQESSLEIFPNPFSNEVKIELHSQKEIEVQILDYKGQAVVKEFLKDRNISLDTSHLPAGMYFLLIPEINYFRTMVKI